MHEVFYKGVNGLALPNQFQFNALSVMSSQLSPSPLTQTLSADLIPADAEYHSAVFQVVVPLPSSRSIREYLNSRLDIF